jgi:hypothetical protein
MMAFATQRETDGGPVTLHAVLKDAIGFGLRSRYQPDKEIPHDLLVLLMQMKENDRRAKAAQTAN